ncbi:MAG: Hsp20/alpha crystallin family protein [Thiovulaceae bacterium]|nr:Hsp20/alpha crystallin family protein [Sulfurimonadaceae bacterium]MCW9026446.1 Hsp20/alpha crystallin family protein [Sulfurimonadaceae bacterium]
MLLTQYNPFKELRDLESRLFSSRELSTEDSMMNFTPKVNTREGEFAYHIDVDLPGVKKEDIKVDIKENTLVISGERSHKEEVKEEDYYRVESNFGKFTRSFTIPDNTDIENIEAKSDNGVLEVVIPKVEPVDTTKSISVK